MMSRRHLTIILRDGALLDTIEMHRRRWDPVMAGVPAHVTVVYPEDVTDETLLLERVRDEAKRIGSFPLDLRDVDGVYGEHGAFLRVSDRTGVLSDLKRRLLAPPFEWRDHLLHVTIVHPRTSHRGPEAIAAMGSHSLAGSVTVSELSYTETVPGRMEVLERFELGPGRVQVVAAVLRRGSRVLLCHRHPGREHFPDTWDLPGGHVEHGEHAADALVRELREELGILVPAIPAAPTIAVSDDELGVDLSVWVVDDWDGEPANTAPLEHDALEWCRAEDWAARPLAHPRYPSLLAASVSER